MPLTHERVLCTIRDEPDNDVHRFVYADWLEESVGDLERAEFIRLECQLCTMAKSDPQMLLVLRRDDLVILLRVSRNARKAARETLNVPVSTPD